MTIKRIGEAMPSGTHELYNNYLYSGEENLLMLSRTFTTEFICNYELRQFPFDSQCKVIESEVISLIFNSCDFFCLVCTMVFVMKVFQLSHPMFTDLIHN